MSHDMTSIVHPINLLVSDELDRASRIHGETFASAHEGFGVIAEEVNEAGDEWESAEKGLRVLIAAIRTEDTSHIIDAADYIRDRAVAGAAELIQVAAMCEKLINTIMKDGDCCEATL